MPALEMAQETGKLVAWLKKKGEPVRKGEMLLEVETDKAVVEIEAAGDGVLVGISAEPGDVVPVGRTIAWLLQPGESVPSAPAVATQNRPADGRLSYSFATAVRGGRRRRRGAPSGARARLSKGTATRTGARRGYRRREGFPAPAATSSPRTSSPRLSQAQRHVQERIFRAARRASNPSRQSVA